MVVGRCLLESALNLINCSFSQVIIIFHLQISSIQCYLKAFVHIFLVRQVEMVRQCLAYADIDQLGDCLKLLCLARSHFGNEFETLAEGSRDGCKF
jgi:hypothetical protein